MQIESETQRIAKRGVFNITFAVNNKNFLTETFLFTHTKLSGKDEAVKDIGFYAETIRITIVRKNITSD